MGARKAGDGQKASNRPKSKSPCRADTRGGPWAGIPKCLIDSPAYRDLSLHARSVLVELVARMNGYNNGEIAVSRRELVEALGCSPRYAVSALVELVDHGIIGVGTEGQWKQRQARLYRLTFVSTVGGGATNEYLAWTPAKAKSGASHAVAGQAPSASHAVAEPRGIASHAVAAIAAHRERVSGKPASHAVALIGKPCPPVQSGQHKGDQGSSQSPPEPASIRSVTATSSTDVTAENCAVASDAPEHRPCENCGDEFEVSRADRAYPRRFCSERCRKRAELARRHRRCKGNDDAEPIGKVLDRHLTRFMAGQASAAARLETNYSPFNSGSNWSAPSTGSNRA